jgi:DNA-binding NarL/FixJ family response regulator
VDVATGGTHVVIADDEVLFREGVASLLDRAGFVIVGQCGDPSELLTLVRDHRPELAIIDIRMPPSNTDEGLQAARTIREDMPDTAIVLLSAHVLVAEATDLLASGTRSGYLLKRRVTDVDQFVETLEWVVRGGSAIDPVLVHALMTGRRADDPLNVLTPRELEVLSLMAEGRSNAGIGHLLFLSVATVEKHVRSILIKLDLPGREDDHRRVLAVVTYLENR